MVLARINQRLSALKADFSVIGYTSTDQLAPRRVGQTQPADNLLGPGIQQQASGGTYTCGNAEGESGSATGLAFNANGAWRGEVLEPVASLAVPQWWGLVAKAARSARGCKCGRWPLFNAACRRQAAPNWWPGAGVGPWQYQIPASQMNQYTAVPHAKIIGGRFTFTPFSH